MLERSVEVVVDRPVAVVYELWSNLENLPRWMQYVREVKQDPQRENHSYWRFGRDFVNIEWTSRITRLIPLRLVAWESVTGYKNRGQIEFFPADQGCRLKLTLAVAAPDGLIKLIVEQVGLTQWLSENLQADLDKFKSLLEAGQLGV